MTDSTDITRTITCNLETSDRKNSKLQRAVSDFRRAAEVTANLLPSFPDHARRRNNSQIYRTVKRELGDYVIKDKLVQNAVHRVIANYRSASELGNELPKDGITDCDFLILTTQGYAIKPNDRGYGLKAKFVPYNPEWWHLDIGAHQREYLERAVKDDATLGQVELAYNNGQPRARIAVKWEQEVTTRAGSEYVVGVDIGLRALYASAVRGRETGEIVTVHVESGDEFQHRRTHYREKIQHAQEQKNHEQAAKLREKLGRYTDDTLHTVAKEIVDAAEPYRPCIIQAEDIGTFREADTEAVHSWPYQSLLDKIENKATAAGIGFESVEPYYTSQTCRKCGYQHEDNRDGELFECLECGYGVNADANAAMNIAFA